MYWEYPSLLLAWWLLPLLVFGYVLAGRRRQAALRQFADPAVWNRLLPARSQFRATVKAAAVVLGLGLLIAGAARPKWGTHFEEIPARGVDLFVLLDVSRSMLATDATPNRLARAKSDIHDLLTRLKGDRAGLITFAGAAVVQVPLTIDYRYFRDTLEDIDTTSAPRGGSLIGDAIRKALVSLEPRSDRDQVLVLITDGEDHDSFPQEAARQAAERGVKIIAVGLGDTEQGHRIPVGGSTGNRTFLEYEGQEVRSRLDEKLLNQIALQTGGAYVPARTRAYDLGQIYDEHLAKLTRSEGSVQTQKRYRERFQLFLLAGTLLLAIDLLLPSYLPASVAVPGFRANVASFSPEPATRVAAKTSPSAQRPAGRFSVSER